MKQLAAILALILVGCTDDYQISAADHEHVYRLNQRTGEICLFEFDKSNYRETFIRKKGCTKTD